MIEVLEKFVREKCYDQMLEAVREGRESISVDYNDLDKYDPKLSETLLEAPNRFFQDLDEAMKGVDFGTDAPPIITLRFDNIPDDRKVRIKDIRAEHIGKFIKIEGTVRRASPVTPEVKVAIFECPDCGEKHEVLQLEKTMTYPANCSCGKTKNFRLVDRKLHDTRYVLLEDKFEEVAGEEPGRINVFMKDDLTDPKTQRKADPGARLAAVGILRELPKKIGNVKSRQIEIYMEANNFHPTEMEFDDIEITPEDEQEIVKLSKDPHIYEKLIRSTAPSMYGMSEIKEAILLQLFGGVPQTLPDGTKIRGDIHLLLMGDPAAGKTQLLKLVSKIIPRGRYVSGKGTSAAGLTATVVKDEEFLGGWVLEAGAIVLSNKSTICVHPDSKVIVNGRQQRIEDVWNDDRKQDVLIKNKPAEVCDLLLKLPAWDNSFTANAESVGIGRRKWSGDLVKLDFKSGFSIRLTPEHQLLNGDNVKWKPAGEFGIGDYAIAPLKLPDNKESIWILDIVPDEWKVMLSEEEKTELRELIDDLSQFNKRFDISRNVFSGGGQMKISAFKKILREFGVYDEWKTRTLAYGRSRAGERLKTAKITPEMGYLMGFIFGDGHVKIKKDQSSITVVQSIKHESYIDRFQRCWSGVSNRKLRCYKRSVDSMIRGKSVKSECVHLQAGSNLLAYLYDYFVNSSNMLLLPDEPLRAFIGGAMDADGCISIKTATKNGRKYKTAHVEFLLSKDPEINKAFMLALRRLDCYSCLVEKHNISSIRITSRRDVETLQNEIRPYSHKALKELPKRINMVRGESDRLPKAPVVAICEEFSKLNKSMLLDRGIWSTIHDWKNMKRYPSRDQLSKLDKRLSDNISPGMRQEIDNLLRRDWFMDEIVNVSEEPYDGWVYDLYVPKVNNFVSDGVFVHNCIDEFDKMTKEDQINLHEAMSTQTVSIAKASIQATLPAQTSILAGANPKFSRFDRMRPLAEQIDLPDTILSRFDLKFLLYDIPDKQKDEALVDHVIKSRMHREEVEPEIKADFIRKYIAYCRQKCKPDMTKDAAIFFKDFFISMRSKFGGQTQSAMPITLRQYEGLMRLSEASARARLSPVVERQDAERAVRLMKYTIAQLGIDPETGEIDIDRLEGGIGASQRNRMMIINDTINKMDQEYGGQAFSISDLYAMLEEQGIDESTAKPIIQKMLQGGELMEPTNGKIQKV